jgi:tetratricopeptide (TPR) repeat protein
MMQRLLGLDRGHLPGALHAFAHRQGALGDGNNVEQGEYTIEEAAQKCVALGAAGFTHHGAAKPSGRVLCYFKSSQAGNADPNWQSYTLDSTLIYQRAVLLKAQQNYDDARKWFTQAIAAGYEDQAECHNQHGECLEKLGNLNDALKEFDQALSPYDDGKPHEARFLYNRGKALFKSGMPEARFTKKVELLKRAEVDLQQALMHIGYNHALQEKIHGRTASITTELAQMAEEAARRGQQLYETQLWSEAFAAFSESLSTKHGNQSKCLFLRAMCSIQKQQPE